MTPQNLIAGVPCHPVICQSRGPTFAWNDGAWNAGDELPERVRLALPETELERCERHRVRRLGMRRMG